MVILLGFSKFMELRYSIAYFVLFNYFIALDRRMCEVFTKLPWIGYSIFYFERNFGPMVRILYLLSLKVYENFETVVLTQGGYQSRHFTLINTR